MKLFLGINNKIHLLRNTMYRAPLILIFLIVTPTLWAKNIVTDGFHINFKGDTVNAKFIVPVHKIKRYIQNQEKTSDDLYYSAEYTKVECPNLKKNQWKIEMLDRSGQKSQLLPSNCRYFKIYFKTDTFEYVSSSNFGVRNAAYPFSYYPDYLFLQLIIKGPLCLYQYYDTKETPHSYSSSNPTFPLKYRSQKYCLKRYNENLPHTYRSLFF